MYFRWWIHGGQKETYYDADPLSFTPNELTAFKKLAKDYASAGKDKIAALLKNKELLEICHED